MVKLRYLSVNVFFLKAMTHYVLEEDTHGVWKVLFYIWRCLSEFCLITLFLQCIIDIFVREKIEFVEISANVLHAGIFFSSMVRNNYYYIYGRRVKEIVMTINHTFKYESTDGYYKFSMENLNAASFYLSCMWFLIVFITGELMMILTLFLPERALPLQAWYPWDKLESPFYEISYLFQALTNFFMAYSYGNPDMFYVCVCMLLSGQFKMLSTDCKNMLYVALVNCGVDRKSALEYNKKFNNYGVDEQEDFSKCKSKSVKFYLNEDGTDKRIKEIINSANFERSLNECFRKCIEDHQRLLQFCKELQAFFSPILLPTLMFATFYIILITFVFVTTDNSVSFWSLSEYLANAIASLLVMCYFGQLPTTEAEAAQYALYETPWYIYSKKHKTKLKIMQMRMSFRVEFTAAKFFTMSLNTFIVIMKSCVSTFAVLRQVTGREA